MVIWSNLMSIFFNWLWNQWHWNLLVGFSWWFCWIFGSLGLYMIPSSTCTWPQPPSGNIGFKKWFRLGTSDFSWKTYVLSTIYFLESLTNQIRQFFPTSFFVFQQSWNSGAFPVKLQEECSDFLCLEKWHRSLAIICPICQIFYPEIDRSQSTSSW